MWAVSGSSSEGPMRFSAFIESELDEIVAEWGAFARTMLPSAKTMSELALRMHMSPKQETLNHEKPC